MSPRAVLLIGTSIVQCNPEWKELSSIVVQHEYLQGNRAEFIADCNSGKYDDVIAIIRSNDSVNVTGPFDAELINVLPESVKFICHNGAGYDNIDIPTCTKKRIDVSSTPGVVNRATADITIFLMLGALRQVLTPIAALRAGEWRGETKPGYDPQGRVLGILGMGGIGTEVARRAKAFDMHIIYHNRKRASPEPEGAEFVTFDSLLSRSDVLCLNCTLTDDTRHIIGRPEFAQMKNGVVIINTARGAVMDEEALVEALENKVASAGLDVFENEPNIRPALRKHPRILPLPHIGTFTQDTQKKTEQLVLSNLKSCLQEGRLLTQVPEQLNLTR
ncbi:hypothetical protein AJ78_05077 [Emergomyces pasteurianus Ep9510]|uniref:Uncharacterized protein n=1 Tax=Emergomyces pasteurianus Ep9510 TaxID=1447872 RepID=A0A1J9PEZ3_9EURO|nr:hypothetical protein AJ78_05077 [Emergomyces pasteurianus Ep9510]